MQRPASMMKWILSVLLCSVGCRIADAQLDCPLSRLDRFPCRFQRTNTFPGPNEYAIYQTQIRLGNAGVPECRVRNPLRTNPIDEVIRPISSLGTENLRLIFSPGLEFNVSYADQILVNYSIQCPEGQLAYFHVCDLNLKDRCSDANGCVDYIEIIRGQFGTTEICPRDNVYGVQLETGSFTVLFRTGECTVTNSGNPPYGFFAYNICFDPDDGDQPGCVPVNDTSLMLFCDIFRTFVAGAQPTGTMLEEAIQYDDACNPVLKMLSRTTLELAERYNIQVHCSNLSDPKNGQVTMPSTTLGSTATYRCNQGYVLMGVNMRTCQTNGQWSDQPPVCTPMDCGDFNNPAVSRMTRQSTSLGSTVTDAQTNRCLLSRLDHVPCTFRVTNTLPQPNEYGIYRTKIGIGANGSPVCRTRDPRSIKPINEVILPIIDLGSANLRLIFSPGLHFGERYANQILVKYRVQCPAGTLAVYNITRLELQEKCENKCVDYVEIPRGQFGSDEYCGSDPPNSTMQLEFGTFDVIFRTSEMGRFPGFEMYIICFDPDDHDMSGSGSVNSTGEGMRKRDLGEHRISREIGMPQFLIAHGDIVTYSQDTITISRNGEVYQRICNVLVLNNVDGNGNQNTFVNEATDTTGNLIQFFGPGPLDVNDCFASLQLLLVNPSGILPSEVEEVIISSLAGALTATLGPQDDFNITQPEPPTDPIPPDLYGSLRTKRAAQKDEASRFIEDDAIHDAIHFENAFNPVLRSTARIVIEVAERDDFDRVNRIRADVMSN